MDDLKTTAASYADHTAGPVSPKQQADEAPIIDSKEAMIEALEEELFHSNRKTDMLKYMLERTKQRRRELKTVLDASKAKLTAVSTDERRLYSITRNLENEHTNIKSQLKQTMSQLKKQQELHNTELSELRRMLAERKRLNDEREEVMTRRSAIIAEAQGDLDEEGEEQLKTEVC